MADILPKNLEPNYVPVDTVPTTQTVDTEQNNPNNPATDYQKIGWNSIYDDDGNIATRNRIFAQNDAPTEDYKEGDLWFDTNDSNKIYRANASLSWVSVQDGTIFSGDFADITGATKPSDNATVGATAGTDLKDSGAVVLDDTHIKNIQTFTAGFAINSGEAVLMHTDGKIYSTDALQASMADAFIGFALEAIAKDATGRIKLIGNIENLSGLTIGSAYFLKNATQTDDQTQTSDDAGVALTASESLYQSFTTGSGITNVSQVVIHGTQNAGADRTWTVRVREGEGTGGTLVGTQSLTISTEGSPSDKTFIFDVPLTVSALTQYSITLETNNATGNQFWREQRTTNPYAGGRNDQSSSNDYHFKTKVSSNRGAIDTSAGTVSKKVGLALSATQLMLKYTI